MVCGARSATYSSDTALGLNSLLSKTAALDGHHDHN